MPADRPRQRWVSPGGSRAADSSAANVEVFDDDAAKGEPVTEAKALAAALEPAAAAADPAAAAAAAAALTKAAEEKAALDKFDEAPVGGGKFPGHVVMDIVRGSGLPAVDHKKTTSSPYLKVWCESGHGVFGHKKQKFRTKAATKTLDPGQSSQLFFFFPLFSMCT